MTTPDSAARNALAEAQDLVGPQWRPHLLEPSPPAIDDGTWFADDPVDSMTSDSSTPALLPTGIASDGTTSWNEWLSDNPEHTDWVQQRWLGGDRRLGAPPASLTPTRLALHRLATYVIAPVRHASNGKFGLRWTRGGFGTPFFGDDRQVRVVGDQLIDQRGESARSHTITTLAAAAAFLESEIDAETAAEHDSPPVGDIDEQLAVDPAAATFLGDWYGMAYAALEQVRADANSVDATRPQIWPGHFDPAIEVGDEDHRGSYGASPGDHAIDEPYLYVSSWWPDRIGLDPVSDPILNAPSFTGAILKLSDFASDQDHVAITANFFLSIRDHITR